MLQQIVIPRERLLAAIVRAVDFGLIHFLQVAISLLDFPQNLLILIVAHFELELEFIVGAQRLVLNLDIFKFDDLKERKLKFVLYLRPIVLTIFLLHSSEFLISSKNRRLGNHN